MFFIFFLLSATVTRYVASPVAALTARVQAAEGDFRAMHATLLQASEATALCSNGAVEAAALAQSFGTLLMLRWQVSGSPRVSHYSLSRPPPSPHHTLGSPQHSALSLMHC